MSDVPNGIALAECYLVDGDNKICIKSASWIINGKNKNEIDSEYLCFQKTDNN